MSKNIVIGKLGRSISFDENKWASIGGDNEPSIFFKNLAEKNPDFNFYMIGRSDLTGYKEKFVSTELDDLFGSTKVSFPKNLIDVWEKFDRKKDNEEMWVLEALKDIDISIGILMSGPVGSINIPGCIPGKRDPNKLRKVLEMQFHYVTPMLRYINEKKLKYITVSPDPRYHLLGYDFIVPPILDFGQYNDTIINKSFKDLENPNYEDKATHTYKTYYTGLETTFLIGREKIKDFNKTEKFNIVLNEGGGREKGRGPELKKYVLDQIEDVAIYGKWEDEWYKDSRFKGLVKFKDLHEKLLTTKYTFIIPIKPGYVTSKFWEMIYLGIIPFMHPDYDSQKNIKCPDYIRVKSAKELLEKIDELEKNPKLYLDVLTSLTDMLTPELFSGEMLNKKIMKIVNKLIQ